MNKLGPESVGRYIKKHLCLISIERGRCAQSSQSAWSLKGLIILNPFFLLFF